MILLIDNNDGLGPQDYTGFVDAESLPKIVRKLNRAATMSAVLCTCDASFHVPSMGARVLLQRGDGVRLFTGYLASAPEQQYLGYGQAPAWRYVLTAVDDSWLLDRNPLPMRTPFAWRTAGAALKTLAEDVLPGVLDDSGVQDVGPVNQFAVVPQKSWSDHAQRLATVARANYRVHDGKLSFGEVGQQSFSLSEAEANFDPAGLVLAQPDALHNDVTVVGSSEPVAYVRDYFLGDGVTLNFYLSQQPYGSTAHTVFQDDFTASQLAATLWTVTDPNHAVATGGGQLQLNGGPVTASFVEQVELAAGLLMQHGKFVFRGPSTGTVGGLYNGTLADANCIAGFKIAPSGGGCSIQALVNGAATGPIIATVAGHQYSLATQLFCSEAHRVNQTYFSSTHQAGNGRGGESIGAAVRFVLTVHEVDPGNPATLAAAATVLYDGVIVGTPGFASYALVNASSLLAGISFTRLQHVVDAEIRSLIPGQQFRTRLNGALADGGECSIASTGTLHFYPPHVPQASEQIVVAYRASGRAAARVQDAHSIAQHANGNDKGRRSYTRELNLPAAPTSIDCEAAARSVLNDAVLAAWCGKYKTASDFLNLADVNPGDAVEVSAPSRDANFSAIVREVHVQLVSLASDRSLYEIKFANDSAEPMAFEFAEATLSAPLTTIYTTDAPSSSMYLDSLTGAQVTDVIDSEITVDAGVTPPSGGGIEVRRSDGGWGTGDSGNLAGRFATRAFTLPRLSRVQGYYLRQYDGSSPAKYSRYSALVHVDYPY